MKIEILYLIAATHFLGFVFSIFLRKRKSDADKLLGVFLCFMSIYFICSWLGYENGIPTRFTIIIYTQPLLQLIGPFQLIYAYILTSQKQVFKYSYLWFFSPFILHYLVDLIMFLIYGKQIWQPQFYFGHSVSIIEYYYRHFLLSIYIFLMFRRLRQYRLRILNRFSNTEKIDFEWLRNLTIYFLYGYIFGLTMVLLDGIDGITLPININTGLNVFICFVLLTMVYFAYSSYFNTLVEYAHITNENYNLSNELLFNEIENKTIDVVSQKNMTEYQHYYDNLLKLMQISQFYFDPELNLGTLAHKLGISVQKLSTTINEVAKKNFFEFVNDFRVEEVKRKLLESENLKKDVVSIGMDCGFNSKSSFFRIFKNSTGLTPSQFHKLHFNKER